MDVHVNGSRVSGSVAVHVTVHVISTSGDLQNEGSYCPIYRRFTQVRASEADTYLNTIRSLQFKF